MRRKKSKQVAEFGDFQTPLNLARLSLAVVAKLNIKVNTIIEPTCGRGTFIVAALEKFPGARRVIGVEINPLHLNVAYESIGQRTRDTVETKLLEGDFFKVDWDRLLEKSGAPFLIVGNPPWVTNAELGSLASQNLPEKSNFYGRSGIVAVTGKSNFDLSEWMLLRYLDWLRGKPGTIAVLCKSAVARKILLYAWEKGVPIDRAAIYRIDSLSHFGAAVDACFFVLTLDPAGCAKECEVFDNLADEQPARRFGYREGHLIADLGAFEVAAGVLGLDKNYTWRSGIKHDCSKIMELTPVEGGYRNNLGEIVALEDAYIYPLLKSSDVGNGRTELRTAMLVTQKTVGESTGAIAARAPNTWAYLQRNKRHFLNRGSVIYKNKPDFSIFGVGDYSFSPWKIAISGLYKTLRFLKVGPLRGKPVVFDDTVNFLACASEEEADFLLAILSSPLAQDFYRSMIHWDEKRPVTVEILRRLHLERLSAKMRRGGEYRRFAAQRDLPLFASAGFAHEVGSHA